MKTTEKFTCPHCGKEIEADKINQWKAGQLGRVSSEKKAIAARENAKKPRPRNKSIKNDFEINVIKDGKPRKLKLENDGGKQYKLYIHYPNGQSVRARFQPKINEGFPDIKFLAVKNGFEIINNESK